MGMGDVPGLPCRLAVDAVLGRHLVATRPIRAGQLILKCRPLAVGPKASGGPVCLGCCRLLPEQPSPWTCDGCAWPLCSAGCAAWAASDMHLGECAVLGAVLRGQRAEHSDGEGVQPAAHLYSAVLPLRCCLLAHPTPGRGRGLPGRRGRAILAMQAHLEERLRLAPAYRLPQGLQRRAAALARHALAVPEEGVLAMAARLDTNAFDVGRDGREARALFGSVSMLAHDCRPNARCAVLSAGGVPLEELELGVVAQCDIGTGVVVSISYCGDSLRGPLERRRHLRATKCFDCSCARCSDPTDLGLRLDSVRCIRCRRGPEGAAYATSQDTLLLPTDPLDADADWRCPRCGFSLSADQMAMGHRRLRAQASALSALRSSGLEDPAEAVAEADAFLGEHLGPDGLLHATSSHVLRVKSALLETAFAHIPGCSPPLAMSSLLLERGIRLTGELLEVAAVLEPGLSVLRGSLLLRRLGLLLERARRGARTGVDESAGDVERARRLFREAEAIFMDLETRMELRKRKAMIEEWIKDNIATTGTP